jgi:hypothetical protein
VLAQSVHENLQAWSDTWKPTPSTLSAGTAKASQLIGISRAQPLAR